MAERPGSRNVLHQHGLLLGCGYAHCHPGADESSEETVCGGQEVNNIYNDSVNHFF